MYKYKDVINLLRVHYLSEQQKIAKILVPHKRIQILEVLNT